MIKLKTMTPHECYVEIDGNRVGPIMNEKEITTVVKWLNLAGAETEIELDSDENKA